MYKITYTQTKQISLHHSNTELYLQVTKLPTASVKLCPEKCSHFLSIKTVWYKLSKGKLYRTVIYHIVTDLFKSYFYMLLKTYINQKHKSVTVKYIYIYISE